LYRYTKGIAQIAPHPVRPLVVAVGANGQLYVWAKSYTVGAVQLLNPAGP
jgi:hypothetical protein